MHICAEIESNLGSRAGSPGTLGMVRESLQISTSQYREALGTGFVLSIGASNKVVADACKMIFFRCFSAEN